MAVTLRQLQYFQALVAERHFGRAAARAGVTQPALSAQIRLLEDALGGPLVERGTPGLALTALGREVAARGARVLVEARALEALAARGQGLSVPLTLGIIPTVAPYLLPPLLPLVRAEGGRVTIREALTETLLDELAEARIDAAVIALPPPRRGIAGRALFADRFLLARPPHDESRADARAEPRADVRTDAPPPRRPEEIDPDTLLLLDEGHCLSEQALTACRMRPEGRRVRLGAASLTTLARLVASGQGVTLIPEIAAAAEGQGLRLSRFDDPEPGRTIGLARIDRDPPPGWFEPLAALLARAAAAVPRLSP